MGAVFTRGVRVWCIVAYTLSMYCDNQTAIASIEYFKREPSILRYIVILSEKRWTIMDRLPPLCLQEIS